MHFAGEPPHVSRRQHQRYSDINRLGETNGRAKLGLEQCSSESVGLRYFQQANKSQNFVDVINFWNNNTNQWMIPTQNSMFKTLPWSRLAWISYGPRIQLHNDKRLSPS